MFEEYDRPNMTERTKRREELRARFWGEKRARSSLNFKKVEWKGLDKEISINL